MKKIITVKNSQGHATEVEVEFSGVCTTITDLLSYQVLGEWCSYEQASILGIDVAKKVWDNPQEYV